MLKRIVINTRRNIRRAPYHALSAVMLLTLTFLVTDIFILFLLGSRVVLHYFETRPQVTAFFTDEVSETNILELKLQMERQDYVADVTYISKAEALKIYQNQNKDDPLLLEMVTADILPASLEVSAKSVDQLPKIRTDLEGAAGVEEVIYQQDIIDALTKWTAGVRTVGFFLVGILLLMSLLNMTIVISMKVASKRQEIATVRLLGATSWFINGPFLFEGAFYGLVGAFLAWGITYIGLLYATPILVNFLGNIPVLPVQLGVMLWLLLGMVTGAVLMGMISGVVSSKRYEQ